MRFWGLAEHALPVDGDGSILGAEDDEDGPKPRRVWVIDLGFVDGVIKHVAWGEIIEWRSLALLSRVIDKHEAIPSGNALATHRVCTEYPFLVLTG